MENYLISFGGGVNSTAIIAMMKLGELPEFTKDNSWIVFADTGAEMPYTYEHTSTILQPLTKEGWKAKSISPYKDPEFYSKSCQGLGLMDYCLKKTVLPSRVNRWCTMEYKSKPIKKFREKMFDKSILVLGICADEAHRAKARYAHDTYYPLIEKGIDRQGCIDKIREAGLPEAQKSGCYFCPYQRKGQWIDLYKNYKSLFDKAVELEQNAQKKFGKGAYWLCRDIPLLEQIEKWKAKDKESCKQQVFADIVLDKHCFCED